MATASNLLQTLYTFEISASPFVLTFNGAIQTTIGGGGSVLIKPAAYPTYSGETRRSIVLPNGSKFDPYQTYDAPVTPGEAIVVVRLKPGSTSIPGALEDTEKAIATYYNEYAMQFVGKRGTLYGAAQNISSSTEATARLIRVQMDWGLPWQIPTDIGGGGNATPGIKTALVTFTFDLITAFTLTF